MAFSGERNKPAHWRDHLVVCGDSPLAFQVVRELAAWSGRKVVVISPSGHPPRSFTGFPGVRVVGGSTESDDILRAAGVVGAAGLAALLPDPVHNTRLTLRAQSLNPQLRLVLAGADPAAEGGVLAGAGIALSRSAITARLFAAAAVGDPAPLHVPLPSRTLQVARRYEVPAGAAVCGLADYSRSDGIRLLPADAPDAELVAAVTEGAPTARVPKPRRPRIQTAWDRGHLLVSPKLRAAAVILLLLLVLGSILFRTVGGYSWLNSIYLTLLDAAGDASAQTTLSAAEKATQVMVTFVGIAWIPLITAAVVDAVVAARLRRMVTGHVIIAGLGDIGSRTLAILHEQGIPVLGIDRNENAPGALLARSLGVPTVTGDIYHEVTWNAASVGTARAVLVLADNDVLNIESAVRARALRGDVPLVLRIYDDDLAEQAQRNFGAAACLSVSRMAGPVFAAALAGHQILGTIQVGRSTLVIADATITADSPLAGRPLQQSHDPQQSWILAVTAEDGSDLDWTPPADRVLRPGDRLLSLSTSVGLASQRRADRRSQP